MLKRILIIVAITILSSWALYFYDFLNSSQIEEFFGKRVAFKGEILGFPDVRQDGVKYKVFVDEIDTAILVNAYFYPLYLPGDLLLVKGVLEEPFVEDGFSYKNYLSIQGIEGVVYRAKIEKIGRSKGIGVFFSTQVFRLRSYLEQSLREIFPEPISGFSAGILLGIRKGIFDDLIEKFNATGLTHILAVSGYNVAIVINFFTVFANRLGRFWSFVFVLLGVLFFVSLVGGGAAVWRAAIMAIISLFALKTGQLYTSLLALFYSALTMTLLNYKTLFYDVGFHLSFTATLGIILFGERLTKFFKAKFGKKLKENSFINSIFLEPFALTLSAQIFTTPIIFYNFGRISLIAPLANLFVLPLIPLAMLFSFLAILAGFFSLVLAKIIGLPAYIALKAVLFFVEIFTFDK